MNGSSGGGADRSLGAPALWSACLLLLALTLHWWWHTSIRRVMSADYPNGAVWSKGGNVKALANLTVDLRKGEQITIGRDALAQPKRPDSAERAHITFRRTGDRPADIEISRSTAKSAGL